MVNSGRLRGLNFLATDYDGQVQEMVDLAEIARATPSPSSTGS